MAYREAARTCEMCRRELEGRHSSEYVLAVVQVELPTEMVMHAAFRAEHGLDRAAARLTGGDLSLGDEAFDDRVWIESADGETALAALEDAGVRAALADAVEAAGTVRFSPRGVQLVTRKGAFEIEQIDAMDRAAIVLGVAMERWARGAPGAEPRRAGCRDRPPEPEQAAPLPHRRSRRPRRRSTTKKTSPARPARPAAS